MRGAIATFRDFMTQRIILEPLLRRDEYGAGEFGAKATYRCRIVGKVKRILNGAGVEVPAMATVYLGSFVEAATPEWRITLEDGSQPPILSVNQFPDERGGHHTVLYLGSR